MRWVRWVKFCLCLVCSILVISACQRDSFQNTSKVGRTATKPDHCRMVQHIMGETCVPLHPQRIVTLDGFGLDTVLALGVKPVGTANPFSAYLDDRLMGVPLLGRPQQPSIEKILLLKPDLILAFSWYHEAIYPKLSEIAPTVVYDFNHGREVRDIVRFVGQTIGKSDSAATLLANYDQRLASFRARIGDRWQQTTVSLIRLHQLGIGMMQRGSFPGNILEEAGISRPASQQYIDIHQEKGVWRHVQINISHERIPDVDADVLFVFGDRGAANSEQSLQTLKADPLWFQLKVVQQNRVYEVPEYWGCCGLMVANRVVDDLFKYFVEQP